MVLILKIALRLVKDATKTSSNIIISDSTGGGKDHLCSRICHVMLDNEKSLFHETMISEKVLNYWEPAGEGSSWNGRVMYLEDPLENTLSSQAFRVRASGNNKQTNLDTERNVIRIEIKGKPVLIITSMKHSIDIEGCRRWDAVRVDTGEELTRTIMDYEYKKAAGLTTAIFNDTLRNGLRNLPRVHVIIPFAQDFNNYMPVELIMRSQNHKFLDYIKASAALHQFQRERDENNRVIATWDDYDYAIRVFNILQNRRGEALNRQEESLINYLKDKPEPVKLDTIVTNVKHISKKWLLDKKDNLIERGLLEAYMLYDIDARREVEHLALSKDVPLESTIPVLKKSKYMDGVIKKINEQRKKYNLKPLNF